MGVKELDPASLTVLAFGCHPDDIEFMMAGTLLLLKDLGVELHYINIANGSCGTAVHCPSRSWNRFFWTRVILLQLDALRLN